MSLEENLKRVVSRYAELRAVVAEHPEPGSSAYTQLLKEFSELGPIVEGIETFQAAKRELSDLEGLRNDPDSDPEMRELAESEYYALRDRLPDLERQVLLSLLPRDEADARNAILEVRAGTGGDEAALFAAELFRLYQRYAEAHRWRFEVRVRGSSGAAYSGDRVGGADPHLRRHGGGAAGSRRGRHRD